MTELSISALSNSTYTSNSQIRRAEAKQPNSIMVAELSEPPKQKPAKKTTFNTLKLTTTTYTIENGDSLGSIASKFGLKRDDLINQLKEQGIIPKNYDPDAKHNHDLKFMKAGTKIKFKYAKTEAQKEEYEDFCTERSRNYQNRIDATVAKGKNGYSVTEDAEKNHKYYDDKGNEISPQAFKKACPNMYKQFPPKGTKEEKESSGIINNLLKLIGLN